MTFQQFISSIGFSNGFSFWAVVAFLMSIGIEIVPKIKWNPWSTLFKWFGSKINFKVEKKVDDLSKKVDGIRKDLDQHIAESEVKSLQDIRWDILDFCNSCMNKRRHTQEEFKFVIKECDTYEKHIEETGEKNGVITTAISEIRRIYQVCVRDNSFLKEGELQ